MNPTIAKLLLPLLLLGCGCTTTDDDGGVDGNPHDLGPSECRSDTDCNEQQSEYCARPGEEPGCGVCFSGDCFSDAECVANVGAGAICEPLTSACSCGNGGECVPGCATTGCGPEADCGVDGRCVTRSCSTQGDCGDAQLECVAGLCKVPSCRVDADCSPPNVLCNPDSYACYRLGCTTDADCGGYCVEGQCYDEPGHCEQRVA